MKKIVLVFLCFSEFVFGQEDYYDKKIGLSNKIEPYEVRIYSSQDAHIERKVFVLKKVEKTWEAVLYSIYFDKIESKKFEVENGDFFWIYILNTKINKMASYNQIKYKEEEDIETDEMLSMCKHLKMELHSIYNNVYINDGKNIHNVTMINPKGKFYEFPNIDEYQYYFKFIWLIENQFNIKLNVK